MSEDTPPEQIQQETMSPDFQHDPIDREHDHKAARAAVAGVVAVGSLVGVGTETGIDAPHIDAAPTTHEIVESTTETIQQKIDSDVLNDWARTFETTGADSVDSLVQVNEFINTHLDTFMHPESIQTVRVTGLASAEGDMADADLSSANPKNEQLAAQRGELTKKALIEAVKQRFGYDLESKTTVSAVEDSLTPEEVEHVDALASKYHFKSHTEMIKLYNRGKLAGNTEITETLDALLKEERGALIAIDAQEIVEKEVPGWYLEPHPSDPVPHEKTRNSRYEEKGYIPEESTGDPPKTKDFEYTRKVTDPSQVRDHRSSRTHKQPLPHNYFSATSRPGRRNERSGHKSVSRNRQGRRG